MSSEQTEDRAYLFLDTNICLHYNSFVSIPWAKLVGKPVCLVFCSTVLRELSRKQVEAPQESLRNRAKKVQSTIEAALLGKQELPKDTTVMHYAKENVAWERFDLAPDLGDDRIIGQVLRFQEDTGHPDVRIVTADTGMRLKARSLNIATVELPEQYRLKVRDEATELRRELERLRNRMPKLSFGFAGRDKVVNYVELQIEEVPKEKTYIPQFLLSRFRTELILQGVSPGRTQEYIEKYLEYMEAKHEWERRNARTIELRFVIENAGSAPAEDVEILLYVPVLGLLREEPPKPPDPPVPPARWPFGSSIAITAPTLPRVPLASVSRYGWGTAQRIGDRLRIRYVLGKLKHQLREELEPLYLTLFEDMDIRPFGIEYEIRADNVPELVSGQLHVILGMKQRRLPGDIDIADIFRKNSSED